MKNTRKKNNKSYNNKNKTKKCMETFVEKKVKHCTNFWDEQIQKLENNKNLSKDEKRKIFNSEFLTFIILVSKPVKIFSI